MISRISVIADHARLRADALPMVASTPLKICVWSLILIGLAARLSPLIDFDNRLFWQYVTEDGYLLQTVARNMAIGLGMSTAEGTIPTNGVQPLATFLFAALHFVAGGAKPAGIALVTLFSTAVAAIAGYYAYRVASRVFAPLQYGRELAIAAAASWFAAPHIITHSMNGLETGTYYAAILITLNYYLAQVSDGAQPLGARQKVVFGLLLGLTFLARNDAVFFIGGLLLAHLALGGESAGGGFRHRLNDCLVAGITSLLVATPWLMNNYVLFGSIVPISGISESREAVFGQNLPGIPANLFTSTFVFAPVPAFIQRTAPVVLMSILGIAISLSCFWLFSAKLALASRRFFLGSLIFAICISAYYGLFFGAPHFLARYTTPLSLFLWFATCASLFFLLNLFFRTHTGFHRASIATVLILTFGAAAFALSDYIRGYAKGTSQMHQQIVEWTQRNVPESQWVGAPQTGTLGFFHDRTINLDGKVNPEALHDILRKGHVLEYARNSKIDYIIDWHGMAGWVNMKADPLFGKEFEVLVSDKQANLDVMRRRIFRSKP